jgi:16S rRNA (guanine(527)-N(7))-methyltransferase RsmG
VTSGEGGINERFADEGGSPFTPGGPILDGLERFAVEVERWARRTHLVGKSKIEENVMTSLLDSLHLLRFAERSEDLAVRGDRRITTADIGSGAGFPGIVWAIARPDMAITLFERREKPSLFLERTIRVLGLGETAEVSGEAVGGERAGRFDLVVSKAAGRFDEMLPIAGELLRPGGVYLTIKGEGWRDEMPGGQRCAMKLESVENLPGERGVMLRLRREKAG